MVAQLSGLSEAPMTATERGWKRASKGWTISATPYVNILKGLRPSGNKELKAKYLKSQLVYQGPLPSHKTFGNYHLAPSN